MKNELVGRGLVAVVVGGVKIEYIVGDDEDGQ